MTLYSKGRDPQGLSRLALALASAAAAAGNQPAQVALAAAGNQPAQVAKVTLARVDWEWAGVESAPTDRPFGEWGGVPSGSGAVSIDTGGAASAAAAPAGMMAAMVAVMAAAMEAMDVDTVERANVWGVGTARSRKAR